jgi:hypothetical protein
LRLLAPADLAPRLRTEAKMLNLEVEVVRDTRHGGEAGQAQRVAVLLAEFISATNTSLDIAI